MLSNISSPTCVIPRLITLSMLKQIQKACLRVGVKTTNDATFPSLYSGYKELPNCSFQILPTQLQKCQKQKSHLNFQIVYFHNFQL